MKKVLVMLIAAAMVFTFVSPASADLSDGLVAYYPFNGNAHDESGNGNDGTVNGATLAEDRFGDADSAYSFDGSGDYVMVPAGALDDDLNDIPGMSASFWVYPHAMPVGQDYFRPFVHGAGVGVHMQNHNGANRIVASFYTTAFPSYVSCCPPGDRYYHRDGTTSYTLPLNKWTHIVAVYDGSDVKIYANGSGPLADESMGGQGTGNLTGSGKFDIGGQSDEWFDGLIDDTRIYDRALSATEIQELYNEVKSVAFSDFTLSKAMVKFKHNPTRDKFEVRGEFTLGLNTDGIDPVNEDVVLTVGSSSMTIPAGSFVKHKDKFEFKGVINGGEVKMKIEGIYTDTFKFKVEAKDLDLTGTANPLDIELSIGDDRGTANVRLEGTLSY